MDKRVFGLVGVNWEVALWIAIAVLAISVRFWDLGYRVLHHDESIHALYAWYLYSGRGYIHDPVFHGPFLYHIEALIFFLFGASDYTSRVGPAVFGTLVVALPFFLRDKIGRTGALVAAFLLTLSPSILYYSRSLRHDMFAAAATVLLVVALWRYREDRRNRWLYLTAGALLLTFTNHELSYITVFIFVTFLAVTTFGEWVTLARTRRIGDLSPEAVFLLFISTITLPLFAPAGSKVLEVVGVVAPAAQGTSPVTWFVLLALGLVSAAVGCWWNRRVWPIAALLFYGAGILLWTSFFSNPRGVETGLLGSLQYWLSQHGYARGGQPVYYYLLLAPLYEFLPLFFGLGGVVYALWRKSFFGWFLSYWFIASFVLYSWAGEKMPWLLIHIAIPCVLLAGLFVGKIIEGVNWRAAWEHGIGKFAALFCVLVAVVAGLVATGAPSFSPDSGIIAQQHLLQWMALCLVFLVVGYLLVNQALRLGARPAWSAFALVVFGLLVPLTMHSSWLVNFYNGDVSTEMLVYVQSTPDVTKVMKETERIGFRTGAGQDLQVAYDNYLYQPFGWYLRDYPNVAFYGTGLPVDNAPVVLVGTEDNHDAAVRAKLGSNYVGQRYKLRWWFPEDYKSPEEWIRAMSGGAAPTGDSGTLGFRDVLKATLTPEALSKLWNYFLYRETFNPLGSTDFYMYVRKDLVSSLWAATATDNAKLPTVDQYQAKTKQVLPLLTWGGKGSGQSQLLDPKNVAVAADGSVYVADTRNNRIGKYDSQGKFVTSWGSAGSGEGQFSEPWGIAVDSRGNVYVADTWNHRIEKFDSNGAFITSWGGFVDTRGTLGATGSFYGPRSIAIDEHDNVYVADTGNHRIQVFDSNGQFLSQHGGRGSGDSLFSEPVGIAIDKNGDIFVADTWNHRIQRFDSSFRLVTQWPVDGWGSESADNKPYLALDGANGLYVSDPENHRIIKFSTDGELLAVWGSYGTSVGAFNLPTGIACDAAGSVYVIDSANGRVAVYPAVQ